jgi:hypothetical protein
VVATFQARPRRRRRDERRGAVFGPGCSCTPASTAGLRSTTCGTAFSIRGDPLSTSVPRALPPYVSSPPHTTRHDTTRTTAHAHCLTNTLLQIPLVEVCLPDLTAYLPLHILLPLLLCALVLAIQWGGLLLQLPSLAALCLLFAAIWCVPLSCACAVRAACAVCAACAVWCPS